MNPLEQGIARGKSRLKNLVDGFRATWKLPRWRRALLIAALSDVLGFGVVAMAPLQWLLDAITALLLFAVLGFRWPLLSALAIEAVPGLQLFPAWILVVAALASAEGRNVSIDQSAPSPGASAS